MKKIIVGIIIGMLLCSGIVYASGLYSAKDIAYNNENSEVTNVNDALDEIKIELENSSKIKNDLSLESHMHSGHPNQINVSGYKTLTVLNTSTTLSITLTADDGTVLSTTSSSGEVIDVSNYDYVTAKFTTYDDGWFSAFRYILKY